MTSLVSAAVQSAPQLSLSGTVRDISGVVPGAAVTLRAGGADVRTAMTDDKGVYTFSSLPSTYYELTIAKEGFDTAVRNFTLGSNTGAMDITLAIGALSTAITVTDAAGKATASRMEIPDRDLPVQVSSVTRQLLDEQGVNDMVLALRNVSGVQAQRFYGVYEQYTIRGFNAEDVMLVDGMRTEATLNRFNTQLNNAESVEVLKGPSSVLYGGEAVGGVINIIRKKPQGTPSFDFMYKGGRFNSHQVAGSATGPIIENKLLYRVDASQDYSKSWRGAGANRTNISPSLTWLINDRARVTVHQVFNRDNFKGDGGLPIEVTNLPDFDLGHRFSIPDDFALMKDSQTNVLFNYSLSPNWEFRDGFLGRRTSEEYFVTEGVYYDADENSVPREGLYFHHHRHPLVNQSDIVGHFKFLNMRHTLLTGYEYRRFHTRTDVTAGDGDGCDCGFYGNYTAIDLATLAETNPRITSFPIVRQTFSTDTTNAAYWQDQIDVTRKFKVNVAGRYDDYSHHRDRIFLDDPGTVVGIQDRHETAYTYRAGVVFAPVVNHQLYFNSSTSFTPVLDIPENGSELKPKHGRAFEAGYRWQALHDRIQTSIAGYHIEQDNLTFTESLTSVVQAGKEVSKGIDIDVNAYLGRRTQLLLNYGYTVPKFVEFTDPDSGDDLSGMLPRFTQKHAANAWLTKNWAGGFTASIGARYLGPMFTNNSNTIPLGGWTTFAGSFGYRHNRWEWSVNAENLFNRKRYFLGSDYSDQVYPGTPINVFTTVRMSFK
jgi:iron complex outermembrane receptor protein